MIFLLMACTAEKDAVTEPEDTSDPIHTGIVVDTETSTSTTETDSPADSDTEDTGTTPPGPVLTAIEVSPAALLVHPGATLRVRAVGTDSTGTLADLAPTWSVEDPDIASVSEEGVVTAIEPGRTLVTASAEGLTASLTLTVDDAGTIAVRAVDARTGLPIDGARVALPFTEGTWTDADGNARIPVSGGGPMDFSVWVDDTYDAVTVCGVVGRSFVVPIPPKDTSRPDALLHGTVDFSSVDDAAWNEVVLGLVAPTVQGPLATLDLDAWFADDRTVTVLGVEVDVPANLVVEGSADDYYAPAWAGPAGTWVLTGPLPFADVTSSVETPGDAIGLLVDHLVDMRWGWRSAVAESGNTVTADLSPIAELSESVVVAIPALPAGFGGGEDVLVLTAVERADAGWVVTGLGIGGGPVLVAHAGWDAVPDGIDAGAVLYAQAEGLGGIGPTSVATGTVDDRGVVTFADLQDTPLVTWWDSQSRELTVDVDSDADFVHLMMTDPHNQRHHFYLGNDWTGLAPNTIADFGRAAASIDLWSVVTERGSFEARAANGDLDRRQMPVRAQAHTLRD